MAIGNSDRFRIMIDDSYRFAQDEVILRIVERTSEGYRPAMLTYSVATEALPIDGRECEPITTAIPRELAELLLSAFGRYFLSSEGDLLATNQRLKRELEQVTRQLNNLIEGIGRLSGK